MQNMDWLEEELGGYEDDYLVIDCPGAPPPADFWNLAEGRHQDRLSCTLTTHFFPHWPNA